MKLAQIQNAISPKKLFLIDSLGAVASAFSLGVILVKWESIFGMPAKVLYVLAFIACIFAVYSFLCYWRIVGNRKPFLKIIAIANLLYGSLTMGLVIYFYPQLTILGIAYFLLELLIIITLSIVELKVANN